MIKHLSCAFPGNHWIGLSGYSLPHISFVPQWSVVNSGLQWHQPYYRKPKSAPYIPELLATLSKNMSDNQSEDHFPSFDDRVRASTRSILRSGRMSPTHSAHGSLYKSSILSVASEKKAKKVRFYRNGDRFFKGMIYAVSPERFRTFDSLMTELTYSPLGDKSVLPHGVRYIFSLDGNRKITDLDELVEGESYVCASTQAFKNMDYPRSATPSWSCGSSVTSAHHSVDMLPTASAPDEDDREYIRPKLVTIVRNGTKPRKAIRILLNKKTAHTFQQVMSDITEAIKLDTGAVKRIFTIGGRQVRFYVSFHHKFTTVILWFFCEVLCDFLNEGYLSTPHSNENFSIESLALCLIMKSFALLLVYPHMLCIAFALSNHTTLNFLFSVPLFKQVTCLRDFFGDDTVFVAYGNEKYSLDDFDVDENGKSCPLYQFSSNQYPEYVRAVTPKFWYSLRFSG